MAGLNEKSRQPDPRALHKLPRAAQRLSIIFSRHSRTHRRPKGVSMIARGGTPPAACLEAMIVCPDESQCVLRERIPSRARDQAVFSLFPHPL
jgi:hypothetical protein